MRGREISNVWLPLMHPLLGTHNPGMCSDWESNQQPFRLQAGTQSTEPHQPGHITLVSYKISVRLLFPFYREGNSGSERLSYLLNIIQLMNGRAGMQTPLHLTPKSQWGPPKPQAVVVKSGCMLESTMELQKPTST